MSTPPPIAGTPTSIYGPSAPPALPWYRVYERRQVGKALGLVLAAAGSLGLVSLTLPLSWLGSSPSSKKRSDVRSVIQFLTAGVSLTALFVGIRLRLRKYYLDPAALSEYIESFHNSSFPEGYKHFDGWDGLMRVATTSMIEAKIKREIEGFIPGVASNDPLTFDELWQHYNRSGSQLLLLEMLQRDLISVDKLKQLAMADLEKSLAYGEAQTQGNPSAPPEDESLLEVSFPVWKGLPIEHQGQEQRTLLLRMQQYGTFLQQRLKIPVSVLQAALAADPTVLAMTFPQLIHNNVKELLRGATPLIAPTFIRHKGIEYLHTVDPKFPTFIASFGHWLIDDQVMQASDFAYIFQRDCLNTLSAVELLEEWYEWPVQHYGHSLGISAPQQRVLDDLYKQLVAAKKDYLSGNHAAQENYDKELKKAKARKRERKEDAKSKATSGDIPIAHVNSNGSVTVTSNTSATASNKHSHRDPAYDSEVTDLEEDKLAAEKRAEHAYEAAKASINSTWLAYGINATSSSSYPPPAASQDKAPLFNVTINLGGSTH